MPYQLSKTLQQALNAICMYWNWTPYLTLFPSSLLPYYNFACNLKPPKNAPMKSWFLDNILQFQPKWYVSYIPKYLLGHEHFLNVWILCEKIKCQRLFTVVDEFNGLGGWIDVDDWKNRTENFFSHYPVLGGQIRQNGQFNESRLLFQFSSWNWITITKGLYKPRLITLL